MTHDILCTQVTYESVAADIQIYFESQPSPFDSYYEMHILSSEFFELSIEGTPAALVGVHDKQLMTLFMVKPAFRRYSQQLFQEAKRIREVYQAYLVTSDELYMAHALETAKAVHMQAYFFKMDGAESQMPPADETFNISLATEADYDQLLIDTGDFFDAPKRQLESGELFIGRVNGEIVAYGIIEPSKIYNKMASIGMIVCEGERQKGYGTKMLIALREHCLAEGIRPIAGCWYYNHQSKKTIEASGMYSQTRLLRVTF